MCCVAKVLTKQSCAGGYFRVQEWCRLLMKFSFSPFELSTRVSKSMCQVGQSARFSSPDNSGHSYRCQAAGNAQKVRRGALRQLWLIQHKCIQG